MLAGGAVALGESRHANAERLRAAGITARIWLLRTPPPELPAETVRLFDLSLASELEPKTIKKEILRRLGGRGAADGWHVFECSGSAPGQALAWSLLTRGGRLAVVGYTPDPVSIRLSNLMALDAEAYGNWGADPALYPEALRLVLDGKIDLAGAVHAHSLVDAPAVLAAARARSRPAPPRGPGAPCMTRSRSPRSTMAPSSSCA